MVIRIAVLVAVASVLFEPSTVIACSCDAASATVPRDATVDVPINTPALLVWIDRGRYELGVTATLRDGSGAIELGAGEVVQDTRRTVLMRFPIAGVLQPGNAYTAEIRLAEPDVRYRTWSFTTGTATDATPPAAPAIIALELARAVNVGFSSSCGDDISAMHTQVALTDDVSAYRLSVTTSTGQVSYLLPPNHGHAFLGTQSCDDWLELVANDDACISVVALDDAGNESAATSRCGVVRDCADITWENEPPNVFDCELRGPSGPADEEDHRVDGCVVGDASAPGVIAVVLVTLTVPRRRRRRTRRAAASSIR